MERLIDNPIPIPCGFGGKEWLEDTVGQLRLESCSRILNLDQHTIRVLCRPNEKLRVADPRLYASLQCRS